MNLKGAAPERFGAIAARLYRVLAQPELEPLYRRVAGEIPLRSGRLLDVGCGGGRLARLLAADSPALAIVGLDASAEMIRQARRSPLPPNLTFRQGEIESAQLSDEFDFVVTLLSFHHWEDPRAGLNGVHRALKPGGRFWIYEPNPEASNEEIRRDHDPLLGILRVPGWVQRRLSRGHGFSRREIEEVVRPAVASSAFGSCEVTRRDSTFRLELRRS